MGKRTGNPRGRPRGAKNKRTTERLEAMRKAAFDVGKAIPDAFEGDAHAFLIAVYKDPRLPVDLRAEAARAAVAYEKPRLSAITETKAPDITPLAERLKTYARAAAIEESEGRVVEMPRRTNSAT